jgi:hypothetical protein
MYRLHFTRLRPLREPNLVIKFMYMLKFNTLLSVLLFFSLGVAAQKLRFLCQLT